MKTIEINLKNPYSFKEKKYESCKQLFFEMLQPPNYKAALVEWGSGNIASLIEEEISDLSFKKKFEEIKNLSNIENFNKPKILAKVQLALVAILFNPEENLVIDGTYITHKNLHYFFDYFVNIREKKEEGTGIQKYLELSEVAVLYQKIANQRNSLLKALEQLSVRLNRFSKIFVKYYTLIGRDIRKFRQEIYTAPDVNLKRYAWVIKTLGELKRLAESKKLEIDKRKAVKYLLKYTSFMSLDGIKVDMVSFRRKYTGFTGKRDIYYKKQFPSDLEVLLLLTAPKQELLFDWKNTSKLTGVLVLALVSIIGLLGVPYYSRYGWNFYDDETDPYYYQRLLGTDSVDVVQDALLTDNNDLIVGGYTSGFNGKKNDFWLLNFNNRGELQWSKTAGGPGEDIANVLEVGSDGYFIGGKSVSDDFEDSLGNAGGNASLIKFNNQGILMWNRFYDVGGASEILGLATLRGGKGIAITGKVVVGNKEEKVFFSYLDEVGIPLWSKKFINAPNGFGVAVVDAPSKKTVLFANIAGQSDNRNLLIIAFNQTGQVDWQTMYRNLKVDSHKLVLQLSDGIVFVGQGYDEVQKKVFTQLVKISYLGHVFWEKRIIESESLYPEMVTLIKGRRYSESYLLLGKVGEGLKGGRRSQYFRVRNNGNISVIDLELESPFRHVALGLSANYGEDIILIGMDEIDSNRKQDIWVKREILPVFSEGFRK